MHLLDGVVRVPETESLKVWRSKDRAEEVTRYAAEQRVKVEDEHVDVEIRERGRGRKLEETD